MGEKIVAAAVDRLLSYDMISLLCQCLDRIGDGCGTGCQCQRCRSPFQSGNALFKHILGGIRQPSVNIAGICQTESVSSVSAVMEDIRCCLIDRNRA